MAFDTTQTSYRNFRESLKQRTSQIVVWAGAGLSAPAGFPTWTVLRERLVAAGRSRIPRVDATEGSRLKALCDLAECDKDLWVAFERLQEALGEASYRAEIRAAINPGPTRPPVIYQSLWSLKVGGFVTLNLDRFAGRAYTLVSPGEPLREFEGINIQQHPDVLQVGSPFVANLHGIIDVDESWVFTRGEFGRLTATTNYKEFIHACFATRIVLFAGISAEDPAAGGHLDKIRGAGIALRGHFWLTNRNDSATIKWAEQAGVQIIFYNAPDNDHSELQEFWDDLNEYIPPEIVASPVLPANKRERNYVLPSPANLEPLPANDIRIALNKEAVRILGTNDPHKFESYQRFWTEYSEPIYRAWSVGTTPGRDMLFDFQLKRKLATGAFGDVYEAVTPDKKTVAIKVLHGDITREPEVLQCFRRGVASMRILSQHNIDGMIPYRDAWEIPACVEMELVDGPNLEDAVAAHYTDSWKDVIRISHDLATIILSAHRVPERVLHRDIRPANILLRDYYKKPDDWKVVVLDFDLSWHRDASGGSMDLSQSVNGYLAPEQVTPDERKYSRNALVDSFGIGMTFFFLASRSHPLFAQHMHRNWEEVLEQQIGLRKYSVWKSLPRRYARLIKWATRNNQPDRWDMTRIQGELGRLKNAVDGASRVDSAELIAEEIVGRSDTLSGSYRWLEDQLCAEIEMKSGYTIRVIGNESAKKIQLEIEWMHTGDRQFESVRKYIGTAADKCASELKAGGWNVWNKRIATGLCRFDAQVVLEAALSNLDKLSQSLSSAAIALRLS